MMIARLNNMAGKKIVKGSEEWQMFQDFWKLCQDIWEPEDADEYWQYVISETDKFYQKYRTPYAREFAIGITNALDQVYKERKKVGNDTKKENESGSGKINATEKR